MEKMLENYFLYKFLAVLITLLVLVDAQNNPSGFINIDCGIAANSSYVEPNTGLKYTSDASYITSGEIKKVASQYSTNLISETLANVRAFPQGARNCYNISLIQGNKYLIKAVFAYLNYDGLGVLPVFDLYLGASKWGTVEPTNITTVVTQEIVHVPSRNYVFVCLVNLGTGTPFISAIEVRKLVSTAYVTSPGVSLAEFIRLDVGSLTNKAVRYPDDVYDRTWYPYHFFKWSNISTNQTIDALSHNDFQPPRAVMRTAGTPINASEPMTLNIITEDPTLEFFIYMHFAELVKHGANQSRHLNISLNGENFYGVLTPDYLYTTTVLTETAATGGTYAFSLFKVGGSTLPPFLNAIEVYYVVNDTLLTKQSDDYAMISIKSTYHISRNWQGDECGPEAYAWEGVTCRYQNDTPPVVISLDLSSSQLTGQIAPEIANLKNLQTLDLSNNSLTGPIPSFLSQLPSLKVLNLAGNNLSGSVPTSLLAKSQNGSLSLSVSGNPELCQSSSCNANVPSVSDPKKKGKNHVVLPAVIGAVVLLVLAAAILALLLWNHREKRQQATNANEPLESKNRQLPYSEILKITNNFERVLGKGGFGTVYYGYLDGTPVAVKMLSPSSAQGYKEFQAEVKLLLRVHHRNLTSLVGYCNEDTNLGLIYEYMANGNLEDHLSESNPDVLSWEGRLRISIEAAQGLEYLHIGCKPQIVHRDIKPTNILLNDQFQAKLADFGLSRAFPIEGGTHIALTVVAGTPGYLDPEYYVTNWITEKSDVYSFGVVLLELITGRPVIAKPPDRAHVSVWVGSMLENGDINGIADPRLRGNFDVSSVWKIVELAMACVSLNSVKRPTMTQVVTELNECLAAETARIRQGMSMQSMGSNSTFISSDVNSGFSPLVR